MQHSRLFLIFAIAMSSAVLKPAIAKDVLDPIFVKAKLTPQDEKTIATEVQQRAKKLADADDDKKRLDARDKLVKPIEISGATPAALDKYAQSCAEELEPLVGGSKFGPALDAANILGLLNNAATSDALVRGLKSEFPAVRYSSARGLKAVQRSLAAKPADVSKTLKALGDAGATEKDELVLRMIYQAVDFSSVGAEFKNYDDSAAALNHILTSRLEAIAAGSHDERKDELAFAAAAATYAKSNPDNQKLLMQNVAGFLEYYVGLYFNPDTTSDSLPSLRSLANKAESSVRQMMKASGVNAPSGQISAAIRGKADKAAQKQATTALGALQELLHKAPWELP